MTNSSSNSPVRKTTGHDSGIEQTTEHETISAGLDPAVIWHGLNAFQRDCLRAVATLGEPKGLVILDRISTYYDEEINHGRLYPNLDQLVDDRLLRKGTKDGRTNSYALTNWGQNVLDARDDILQGGVER